MPGADTGVYVLHRCTGSRQPKVSGHVARGVDRGRVTGPGLMVEANRDGPKRAGTLGHRLPNGARPPRHYSAPSSSSPRPIPSVSSSAPSSPRSIRGSRSVVVRSVVRSVVVVSVSSGVSSSGVSSSAGSKPAPPPGPSPGRIFQTWSWFLMSSLLRWIAPLELQTLFPTRGRYRFHFRRNRDLRRHHRTRRTCTSTPGITFPA